MLTFPKTLHWFTMRIGYMENASHIRIGYGECSRSPLKWIFGVSSHYIQHPSSSQSTERVAGVPRLVLLAIQGKIELISDLQKAGTLRFKVFSARYSVQIFSHVPCGGLIMGEELGIKR